MEFCPVGCAVGGRQRHPFRARCRTWWKSRCSEPFRDQLSVGHRVGGSHHRLPQLRQLRHRGGTPADAPCEHPQGARRVGQRDLVVDGERLRHPFARGLPHRLPRLPALHPLAGNPHADCPRHLVRQSLYHLNYLIVVHCCRRCRFHLPNANGHCCLPGCRAEGQLRLLEDGDPVAHALHRAAILSRLCHPDLHVVCCCPKPLPQAV